MDVPELVWIGVDIGGTFTDVIAYDHTSRELRAAKSLSTPDDPVRGVIEALRLADVSLDHAARFVHGTTRVTNALLEHAGSRVAMITTAGFRDVIEMGRGHRPRLYSVKEAAPRRLVERPHRFGIPERLLADGSVHVPLDEAATRSAFGAIEDAGITDVAICFLHSPVNPAHERRAAAIAAAHFPNLACSVSSDVVCETGEYERFATTVMNAAVRPLVDAYLSAFEAALAQHGYRHDLSIMTSSGGTISTATARRLPIQLALSGPAGGVAAAVYLAGKAGLRNVITCDMGGTSADVSLIRNGQPIMTNSGAIGGVPNKTPQIEINTIGAGGGSIAWVDVGGELCIGPQSAGSVPGPVCYGRGGTRATTTDAHLVVGHLDAAEPLGGAMRPDLAAARRAIRQLGEALGGMDEDQVALGIIRFATAKMTSAIKEISVARGHDPRDFVLLPFGGAGPMHATALAEELGMDTVFIPPVPGNLSAFGFIAARARHDLARPLRCVLDDAAIPAIAAAFAALQREGERLLGADAQDGSFYCSIGMRIHGQSFDLRVPVTDLATGSDALRAQFAAEYRSRYAYLPELRQIDIVDCRLTALGPQAAIAPSPPAPSAARASTTRTLLTADGPILACVLHRDAMAVGDHAAGPCIIRESGATTVIGTGWTARVDADRNLVVARDV